MVDRKFLKAAKEEVLFGLERRYMIFIDTADLLKIAFEEAWQFIFRILFNGKHCIAVLRNSAYKGGADA